MKLPEGQAFEAEKEKVEQVKQSEAKYPRVELIQKANDIFQVPPEVVEGALHGNSSEELTLTEVRKAIQMFLKKKHVSNERKVK